MTMQERSLDATALITPEEVLRRSSVGEAILVVHFDPNASEEDKINPKIAIVVEKKSKPSSKRIAGQKSIPIETKKVGESRVDNIRGGVAEICDDETLGRIRENLFLVNSGLGHVLSSGNVVGLAVLIYDGPISVPFVPTNVEEVEFGGWLSANDLLQGENVREIARDFVDASRNKGLIHAALRDFREDGLSIQLFPPGFSINRHYLERERTGVDVKFTL